MQGQKQPDKVLSTWVLSQSICVSTHTSMDVVNVFCKLRQLERLSGFAVLHV